MTVQLKLPISNINVVTLSAVLNVTKEVKGDMELIFDTNRCSLDMKTCEKYPGANIRGLCEKFEQKNAFYTPIFENFKPAIKCPLKPDIYTLKESKMDFSLFSLIPLDGYVWVVTIKVLSAESGIKKKEVAMCLNTETKIVRATIKKLS